MTFGTIKAYDRRHNNEALADAAAPRQKIDLRRSFGNVYRRKSTAARSNPGNIVVQKWMGVMVVCFRARRGGLLELLLGFLLCLLLCCGLREPEAVDAAASSPGSD